MSSLLLFLSNTRKKFLKFFFFLKTKNNSYDKETQFRFAFGHFFHFLWRLICKCAIKIEKSKNKSIIYKACYNLYVCKPKSVILVWYDLMQNQLIIFCFLINNYLNDTKTTFRLFFLLTSVECWTWLAVLLLMTLVH